MYERKPEEAYVLEEEMMILSYNVKGLTDPSIASMIKKLLISQESPDALALLEVRNTKNSLLQSLYSLFREYD